MASVALAALSLIALPPQAGTASALPQPAPQELTAPLQVSSGQESSGQGAGGGLMRVAPDPSEFGSARDGVRKEWRTRLLDADLDRREHSFERLIEAVRRSPSLGSLLREWATDERHPDLAWTARMALRELSKVPQGGLLGQLHGGLDDPWSLPLHLGTPPTGPHRLPLQGADVSEGITMEQTPGRVVIRIERGVDGQRELDTYEGRTLDEIFEANPGLRERLQDHRSSMPRASLDDFFGDWWASPSLDRYRPWSFGPSLRTDVLGVVVREPTHPERNRFGRAEGGLMIERVAPGTIAEFLGLRVGELLVELNGRSLQTRDDISAVLRERPTDGELRAEALDAFGRARAKTWLPAPSPPSNPGSARPQQR